MDWYLLAWKRATDFSGRSRRKEYWFFQLFNLIIFAMLVPLSIAMRSVDSQSFDAAGATLFIYCLIVIVPSLSVTVRRLHDIGKSGWWYLIGFVPVIGGIILLVFSLIDSEPYPNEYGLNPKAADYSAGLS